MGCLTGGNRAHQQPATKLPCVLLNPARPLLGVELEGWGGMIPLGELRITQGYYEVITCGEIEEYVEDEKTRQTLRDYCKARERRDIEILRFVIVKDGDGNILRVWSIEMYYGPFGLLIFADNP
jgi:hypothetical protein